VENYSILGIKIILPEYGIVIIETLLSVCFCCRERAKKHRYIMEKIKIRKEEAAKSAVQLL
jgi:hypothetical protein